MRTELLTESDGAIQAIALAELPEQQIESIFCRNAHGVEQTYRHTHNDIRWFLAQYGSELVRPDGESRYIEQPGGRFVALVVQMRKLG